MTESIYRSAARLSAGREFLRVNGGRESRTGATLAAAERLFVVLPTWNAGRYLSAQLDSLAAQSRADWTLLVRDDGSSDATMATLRARAAADERIVLLSDGGGRCGACAGFGRLLLEAYRRGADYVACCDQDDVWHAGKLARQIASLKQAAGDRRDEPLLSTCGADLVDADLRPLGTWRPHVEAAATRTGALAARLLRNVYPGCTLVANRALLAAALPLPRGAAMHDWWLALVATAVGRVVPLDEPLVQYRQHATNTVGAGLARSQWSRVMTRPWRTWQKWCANQQAALVQMLELGLRIRVEGTASADVRQFADELLTTLSHAQGRGVRRLLHRVGHELSLRDRLALRVMRGHASRPELATVRTLLAHDANRDATNRVVPPVHRPNEWGSRSTARREAG